MTCEFDPPVIAYVAVGLQLGCLRDVTTDYRAR
jgi:hypothetical protein